MKINFKDILKNISLIQYTILLILIVITFALADFYNLNKITNKNWIKNTVTEAMQEITNPNDVYTKNEEIYLNVDSINNNFNDSVYLDKISRTAICTMEDKVMQFGMNSLVSTVNYVEINNEMPVYIKENNEDYINLEEISNFYGVNYHKDSAGNICIFTEIFDANFTKSYVNFKSVVGEYILHINTKEWEVKVIIDNAYYDNDSKYYTIIVYNDDISIIGQVLKKFIKVPIIQKEEQLPEVESTKFKSMIVNSTNTTLNLNVDINLINLVKLSSSEGKINVTKFNKIGEEYSVYAIYSNGYTSPTYDNAITSGMLQNLNSRNYNIQNIMNYVVDSNLDGIVLDFRNLKVTDKEYFEQYIKELAATLHSINVKLMVYVKQNTDYIDLNKIIDYVDNVIYVTYLNLPSISRISYSLSNVYDIERSLQSLKNIHNVVMTKIILEIPLYSVLWVEKNSVVATYELYSIDAIQSFLKENNITHNMDKITGLNYAEFEKGSLKYKVWIEDESSIRKKHLLAQNYMLGGIVLYKNGYETSFVYDILKGE